ncbi:hypothetical protein GOV09_05495 [Candidatus Woesearchaeota archaeon]|nr:hypothetical protein [Candidatus Woesearchaeota archaeon]
MVSKDMKIHLELEKSRIAREKAKLILDKSLALYIIFMLIAVLGFFFDYIDPFMLNTLILLGIIILLAGAVPYVRITHREEKKIDKWLK